MSEHVKIAPEAVADVLMLRYRAMLTAMSISPCPFPTYHLDTALTAGFLVSGVVCGGADLLLAGDP